jgi:hypothetical protein
MRKHKKKHKEVTWVVQSNLLGNLPPEGFPLSGGEIHGVLLCPRDKLGVRRPSLIKLMRKIKKKTGNLPSPSWPPC